MHITKGAYKRNFSLDVKRRIPEHCLARLWLIATIDITSSHNAQHNQHKYQCFLHKMQARHRKKLRAATIMPTETNINIKEFPIAHEQHTEKRAQKATMLLPRLGDAPFDALLSPISAHYYYRYN